MLYDEKYNYLLIDEDEFDMRVLIMNNYGEKLFSYTRVYYENGLARNYYDDDYDKENIIVKYKIQGIVSSCRGFDGEYLEAYYYNIEDLGCFIKYKSDLEELKKG